MASDQIATRRRYSKDLKAQVLAECEVHGASVAKVSMAHGINANIVHGWRKLAREGSAAIVARTPEFVPVRVEVKAAAPVAERDIEVEVRRGGVTMKIIWPLSAAAGFAAWSRELLR